MFTDKKIHIFIKKHKNTTKMKFTSPINNDLKLTDTQFNTVFTDVSEICKNKFGKDFCHVELQGSYFCHIYNKNVLCFTVFTEKVIKFEGFEDTFTETNTQSVEALINDKKQILKKQVEFLNPAIYK